MSRCCKCHHDIVKNLPRICLICHNASWCSQQCKETDRAHSLICSNNCISYTESLRYNGGQHVPIGAIQFARRLADNDCKKAWEMLVNQGVVLSSNPFVGRVSSGPEIVFRNSVPSSSIGNCVDTNFIYPVS